MQLIAATFVALSFTVATLLIVPALLVKRISSAVEDLREQDQPRGASKRRVLVAIDGEGAELSPGPSKDAA